MQSEGGAESKKDVSAAPRSGLRLMIIILVAMTLLSIYANVQKARRNEIETVTVIPAPTAVPAPSLSRR